jgi:Flp pilus assembly protein TadD
LEQFRDALRLKPDDADTLNYIGAALARLGRRDQAMESFRQALKTSLNHADARENLSRLTQPGDGAPR